MKKYLLSASILYILSILAGINQVSAGYGYESCYSTYGFASQENYNGTCSCMTGYSFAINLIGKKECISIDQQCKDQYGYGSKAKGESCICKDGYGLEEGYGGKRCQMQFCGLYASFNDDSKQCECNDGYIQDTGYYTFTCREKAYSTYAIIKEVNGSSASVTYYDPYGIINYSKITSYTCSNMKNYVGSKSVLNFMYDKMLNFGDYLILPNEDVCDIASVKKIDKNESIGSCGNNSISIDGKCSCIHGYMWEYPDDSKNFDCKVKPVILTADQSCQVSFGIYAVSVGNDKCNCRAGYRWTADQKSCEPEPTYTTPIKTAKKLVCKKGELIRNKKCVNSKTLK